MKSASATDMASVPKVSTRVEWENNAVDVFIDEDEEALLMTAQGGVWSKFFKIVYVFSLFHVHAVSGT